MYTLLDGNLKTAKKLLRRKADINYVNKKGKTALHLAIENEKIQAISLLIDHHAKLHIMDFDGEDACDKLKARGLEKRFHIHGMCSKGHKNTRIKAVPSLIKIKAHAKKRKHSSTSS